MFPSTPEAWIFISVSCLIGFLLGQWLKSRRKKNKTPEDYIEGLRQQAIAENRARAQKEKGARKKKPGKTGTP